jgi:exopolysaccharide biosynthesis polyprenyl glycosylphosphotransferase
MTRLRDHIWKSRRLTALLIVLDAMALSLLWILTRKIRFWLNPWFPEPINVMENYSLVLPALVSGWCGVLALYGHYAHRERISSLNQMSRILKATLWCLWVTIILSYLTFRRFEIGRSVALGSTLLIFLYLYTSRSLLRYLKKRALMRGEGARKVLIVGVCPLARRVAEHLIQHPEIGFRVAGFVAPEAISGADKTEAGGIPVVGAVDELGRLIETFDIDEVFFADPLMDNNRVLNLVVESERTGASFKIVSDEFFRVLSGEAVLEAVDGIPVTRLGVSRPGSFDAAVKRAMDLAVAIGLAPLWCAAWGVIALIIWLDDGRPLLFKQRRVGLDGVEFDFHKFRTMRVDTPAYAVAPTDPNDARITRIGRWLRKTSLDEIPQFWNVIKGDMSMVGPRPEMPFIVAQYEEWQRARLDVKPGITGLWQVVGRKNLPLEFNIEYDLWYLRNRTLLLDLSILVRTVPAVLFGKGAF